MNRTAEGVFETYAAAGQVVRELELLGISGEQVEVVSDASYDVRGIGIAPNPKHDNPTSSEEEHTIVIVRPSDDRGMEQARTLMDRYGAKLFRWKISADGAAAIDSSAHTTPDSSMGGPGTTGSDPADLEGRGKRIEVRGVGIPRNDRQFPN